MCNGNSPVTRDDPQTQEKLDTLAFAEKLETQVREPLSTDKVSIHIIGFAKMAGDVAGVLKAYCYFLQSRLLLPL